MLTPTYSQASRTSHDTNPSLAAAPDAPPFLRPRARWPRLLPGLSLALLAAATAWFASARLLEGWQFF